MSSTNYTVQSNTVCGLTYNVDMDIGTCSCPAGIDGSPCSHQAAVVLYYKCASINCVNTTPEGKRSLAFIAFGENSVSDLSFYQTINEFHEPTNTTSLELMHMDATEVPEVQETLQENQYDPMEENNLCAKIDTIAESIKKRLQADDTFKQSISKFASTFETLSAKPTNAYLTSAFHRFGWCFGGTIRRQQGGIIRRGRRIPVQATSAGRRRKTGRGKGKVSAGRTPLLARDTNFLPVKRVNNSVKRPHSLNTNCQKGQQNGGKW